jgi:hypothetical protein
MGRGWPERSGRPAEDGGGSKVAEGISTERGKKQVNVRRIRRLLYSRGCGKRRTAMIRGKGFV